MSVAIHPARSRKRLLHIRYGDEKIVFERLTRREGSSRVLIKVHSDCRVVASAPDRASDTEVAAAVMQRSRWVYQQLRDFRQQLEHITPRQYVSGESHYYLGKQYLLKVLLNSEIEAAKDAGSTPKVKLLRGKIEVMLPPKNPGMPLKQSTQRLAPQSLSPQQQKVQQLLADWYSVRARDIFLKRLDAMLEQALWVADKPTLHIRTMQTRWGSCSPNGRLTINPHLVKAPRECIDYVILHELCHLAEHNHSERFYRLMNQVMPNWEDTKERLDRLANVLISDRS